jgi:hypothetical protein
MTLKHEHVVGEILEEFNKVFKHSRYYVSKINVLRGQIKVK